MNNMEIYNRFREVPQEAKRTISAGNLKGFTDVNPMWRIKKLTEEFGVCGIGWYTEITDKWLETGADGRTAAFVQINLYVKVDGEWSKPIVGVGGSMFVNIFKGSQTSSDEAYKMSYTDAISIACKALGMAADVYYEKDRTKYNALESSEDDKKDNVTNKNYDEYATEEQADILNSLYQKSPKLFAKLLEDHGVSSAIMLKKQEAQEWIDKLNKAKAEREAKANGQAGNA